MFSQAPKFAKQQLKRMTGEGGSQIWRFKVEVGSPIRLLDDQSLKETKEGALSDNVFDHSCKRPQSKMKSIATTNFVRKHPIKFCDWRHKVHVIQETADTNSNIHMQPHAVLSIGFLLIICRLFFFEIVMTRTPLHSYATNSGQATDYPTASRFCLDNVICSLVRSKGPRARLD